MTTIELGNVYIENGHHRRSVQGSDGSVYYSDEEGVSSPTSQFYSTAGSSFDEFRFACISESIVEPRRHSSSASELSRKEALEIKVHLGNVERDCRICQLSLVSHNNENGVAIQLGCYCTDDLGAAHKHCAEAWFKIKGNKTCEICNGVARNVGGPSEIISAGQSEESSHGVTVPETPTPINTRKCWNANGLWHTLLACIVFISVIYWLIHFRGRLS